MIITRFLGLITILVPLSCLASNPESHRTEAPSNQNFRLYQPTPGLENHSATTLYLSANESAGQQLLPLGVSQKSKTDQETFPNLDLPTEPDRDGLIDDTKLFLLYQVAVVGVIYFMPESSSQWSDEDKNGNPLDKWKDNVNNLRKDQDDWAINYIGHPYFGSVYYVRARHRGYDRQGSLWYSIMMSTIYEYGIEALFEPVSIQDLIFTPIGGAVLGEYMMMGRENTKRDIASKGYASGYDSFKLFITDPLGVINEKVNKLFGHKENEAQLNLLPLVVHNNNTFNPEPFLGLQAYYSW